MKENNSISYTSPKSEIVLSASSIHHIPPELEKYRKSHSTKTYKIILKCRICKEKFESEHYRNYYCPKCYEELKK
jgi:hypothetical protein